MEKPEILCKRGPFQLESHAVEGVPHPMIVLRTSDSVAGLLYDRGADRVLLVRQRRTAMERPDNPDGSITELVAGRFDVALGPKALLVKEAREEAGVTLAEEDIVLLNGGRPLALSAGVLTERCYLGFAEIAPDGIEKEERTFGLAEEGEVIGRVWMSTESFIAALETGAHECLRTFALALHLRDVRKEAAR